MSFFLKVPPGPLLQRIDPTTPPSTRNAAPLVAEDSGLATNATMAATSSVVSKRCKSELGLTVRKNSCSTSAGVTLFDFTMQHAPIAGHLQPMRKLRPAGHSNPEAAELNSSPRRYRPRLKRAALWAFYFSHSLLSLNQTLFMRLQYGVRG